MKAGVARADISPLKPMFLVGYPHVQRMSTGVHDPLYATALYLGDASTGILLVSLDILYISHRTAAECREAIHRATGVPPDHVMFTATHTHSGPLTVDLLAWQDDPVVPPTDPEYVELFKGGIIASATRARETAEDARLAVAAAPAEGVGGNRLSRDGIHDHEAGLIFVRRRRDGSPLALALVYSMHPTVLHEDSTLVSADFPGFTRAYLEQRLPGLTVLYHTGPCGNLSPRYHVSAQTFAEAGRLGVALGTAVENALRRLKEQDFADSPALAARQTSVELPGRRFPPVAEAEANLQRAKAEFQRLKREDAGHGPVRTAECTVFGAEEQVTMARAQATGRLDEVRRQYSPVEVQALRAGDAWIVGLPGECFVEYALEIKRRARVRAFVASMANGELQGYIVTPGATGYEAQLSFFAPEAGRVMVDAALGLLPAAAR